MITDIKEYMKAYRKANKEYYKAYGKKYRETHSEYFKEYQKRYKKTSAKWTKEKCLWYNAFKRAQYQKLDFDIEEKDISIPETCPVFNIPMYGPSIDRINNSKGYVKGNICVISKRANNLKGNKSIEELEERINQLQLLVKYMKLHLT